MSGLTSLNETISESNMKIIKHFVDEVNNAAKEHNLEFAITAEEVEMAICDNHEKWFVEDLIPQCYDNNDTEAVREEIDNAFDPQTVIDDLYEAFAAVIENTDVPDEQADETGEVTTLAFNTTVLTLTPEDKQRACDEFTDILHSYFNKLVKSYNEYMEVNG